MIFVFGFYHNLARCVFYVSRLWLCSSCHEISLEFHLHNKYIDVMPDTFLIWLLLPVNLTCFFLHIDLLHVASLCDKQSFTESQEVSLRCFSVSFGGGWSNHETTILSDLPLCCKPSDGSGILINVKGKERWQPFASSSIKILCKCLTEGTLYVEGLLETSSVLSACTLLCFGDVDVHMVGTSIAIYLHNMLCSYS